jgi:hypothetical protein
MTKYKIFTIILALLIIVSCEDYLDKQPLDEISASSFWQSQEDFEMALTAIYGINTTGYPWSSPPGGVWASLLPNWDNLTDNSYGQHNYFGTGTIISGDISPSTGGYITLVYQMCYQAIARTNILLNELQAYEGTDFSGEDKLLVESEARFFRALYYFYLFYTYGDVPLILEPLSLEEQYQPKTTAEAVYNQIIIDLDYAINNLNTIPYYDNSGHVTKSTAQALKARVLIYKAYGNDGNPDNNLLSQVISLCQAIIPEYELSPVFEDLFLDAGQSGNKEIIYAVNYLAPDNVPATGPDLLYGDWLVVSPLRSFIDAFQCSDGLSWEESPLSNSDSIFKNRDPRLNITVFEDHPEWEDEVRHIPTNSRPTGYGLKKFLDPANLPFRWGTISPQNAVVIRLAEVLLMYAEAQNEVSGPDASVYAAINSIRQRVGMPVLPEGLTKDDMRRSIRYERRIEMAFEGLRYFDLKRWHIADEILLNVSDGIVQYNWEDRFYHWPLPQSEIEKSNGILKQNPDYVN